MKQNYHKILKGLYLNAIKKSRHDNNIKLDDDCNAKVGTSRRISIFFFVCRYAYYITC